jgi:hypothetical protein
VVGELLEHGPPRAHRPRWVSGLAALAVLAGGGYLVGHGDGLLRSGASPAPSPASSPAATVSPESPAAPVAQGRPWPAVPGACGNVVERPQVSAVRLRERTGLQVLVGGAGLRAVELDSGRVRRVRGAFVGRRQVSTLVSDGRRTHAIAGSCSRTSSAGEVMRVDGLVARHVATRPADTVLAGAGESWGMRFETSPGLGYNLQPLGGGEATALPADFAPLAATSRYFVGGFYRGLFGNDLPQLAVVGRSARRGLTTFGRGTPLAAVRGGMVSSRGCGTGRRCVLDRTPLDGGPSRLLTTLAGRSPSSDATVARDGRSVAFLTARSRPDPRLRLDHPGGPSDVVVLDAVTGATAVVPGLELAPKSFVGLAFSPDGRWLVVGLNDGSRTRLLVWRRGWDRPRESAARLPGRVQYGAPVLVTAG